MYQINTQRRLPTVLANAMRVKFTLHTHWDRTLLTSKADRPLTRLCLAQLMPFIPASNSFPLLNS